MIGQITLSAALDSGRLSGLVLALLAIGSEAGCLAAFKRAADLGCPDASGAWAIVLGACRQYRWIISGVLLFIVHGLLWTAALKFLDISLAYPVASMELVFVALLCRVFLKETVSGWRWAGIFFVVAGTILVGLS